MKKLLLVIGGLFASFGVFADDANANFSATEAGFCTVVQATAGEMEFTGTSIASTTPAAMTIVNNEAAAYKVGVTDPGDFATKPNGYTGTAAITASYNTSGANTIGATGSAVESNLDNVGTTTLNVSISGSMDVVPVAGDYTAISVVSCVAQ